MKNLPLLNFFQFAAVFLALVISVYSCNISRQANEISRSSISAKPLILDSHEMVSTDKNYADFYFQQCTSVLFLKNEGGLNATISSVVLSSKFNDEGSLWNLNDKNWILDSSIIEPIGVGPMLYSPVDDPKNTVFGVHIFVVSESEDFAVDSITKQVAEDFRKIDYMSNNSDQKQEDKEPTFRIASWQVLYLQLLTANIFGNESQPYKVEASLPVSIETGEIKKLFLHSLILMFDPTQLINKYAKVELDYKILFAPDVFLNHKSKCGGGKRGE